jgi:dTDP-4-dehydrorhamnose reductase
MRNQQRLRVLIFGASGMLGSTLYRVLSADPSLCVFGTVRDNQAAQRLSPDSRETIISHIHLEGEKGILTAFAHSKPDIVVNCIGIIKQLPTANDHLESLAINSSLPHRLAKYCSLVGSRLVHFSTDCVFSGKKGQYREADFPDANDIYGRTKLLGEVDYSHAITLRTSIIGHELATANSLVDWFLGQSCSVKGFNRAVFSGLPTVEIARIIRDLIIPNPELRGLYHLSVQPINKHDLLQLIAQIYEKAIEIVPDSELVIDRSLNSDRFCTATGFEAKSWPELIKDMHDDYLSFQAGMN